MTQAEFIARLDRLIAALPAEERRRAAEFYSELILDRMENGKTEEEAVADCGPVEEIAEKVMAAYTPVRQPSLFLRVMKIIALIFGVPILLSIAAGAMIFITVEDLIPESQAEGHGHGATYGFLLGFWLMALLGILGG